jgi:hypothetical protein
MSARAAKERWQRSNAESRAAGCRCGRPSEVVRQYGPCQVWTCAEHADVLSWHKDGDGPWVPVEVGSEFRASTEAWRTG